MQKIKFQINGMHCQSCAALIEEKLKNQPGIIKIKTSYDSQKAVVMYDEQKIQEPEIANLIEGVGDYQAEKIEEQPEKEEIPLPGQPTATTVAPATSLKFLTSLIIISLGLSIASLVISFKSLSQKENGLNGNAQAAIGQNLPAANNNVADVQTFNINQDNHIRGNFNAPITLVEFSDFECPFCGKHYPTLKKILSDYQDKVRLVYKHFPLPFHSNSQKAAEASECASEQGKFWEYHDKLFDNQSTGFSVDNFKQWAKDLNLDSAKFNSCLDSGKYASLVKADLKEGEQKGVNGTPSTFVNGQLVSGAQPYETFKQIIDNLLK